MADYQSIHTGDEIDQAITKVLNGTSGIQGIKVNDSEVDPDAENKISINIPSIVQTTGESLDAIMSQSAVTNALSEKISDTEIGTWTPEFVLGGYGTVLPTYTTTSLFSHYYRVGKVCYINFWWRANITDPGTIRMYIGGLPFTVKSDGGWQTIPYGNASETAENKGGSYFLYSGQSYGCVRKMNTDNYEALKTTGLFMVHYSGFYIIDSVYY